jgi:ferric-dicitrate binding protein FerR (iron transport regulator)
LIREIEVGAGQDGIALCQHGEASPDVCTYSANGSALLEKASEFFVASMSRPGEALAREIDVWLEQSPCHHCAWHRISTIWQALPRAASDPG